MLHIYHIEQRFTICRS